MPSLGEADLVQDFAGRLAKELALPVISVLEKTKQTLPQKQMANSAQQAANVISAFRIKEKTILPEGLCLLVDDIVDSRWTLTVTTTTPAELRPSLRSASSAGLREETYETLMAERFDFTLRTFSSQTILIQACRVIPISLHS